MKRVVMLVLLSLVILGCESESKGPNIVKIEGREIIDVHEQIYTIDQVPRFLNAMDRAGVDRIVVLGSPDATFIYKEGFENHHVNNRDIMQMVKENPDRFIAFPTVDPRNESELKVFKQYIEDGATGLRIFSGQHAWFYRFIGPVNRTEVYPTLEYCEENGIPVMWNMNPGKGTLMAEFEDVLQKFPNLNVVCPHFCLSSINSSRFEYLMDKYPNMYTDISFGHFFEDGLKRISRNTTKFRDLFVKYQDRILFGIDLVVTNNTIPANGDPSEWMTNLTICYRDMLERENYDCSVHIKRVFNVDQKNLNGLDLSRKILNKVYEENPKEWMNLD
ncbi:amidohydrolase family protein [Nanoarchaeota archaeon]